MLLTPAPAANRPGLSALAYRVGTHPEFLETMIARLSGAGFPELAGLRTRDPADPSIALLDAWASVGDVLSFYQERIANEGYLRTATERRSILELARLVGYRLRPGVAATAYLAYALEKGHEADIPIGTRAQSVPGSGELPQAFETAEPLKARADWNELKVRLTRPQRILLEPQPPNTERDVTKIATVYFQGTTTRLQPGDPLLFVFASESQQQVLRFVARVEPQQPDADRTKVALQLPPGTTTDVSTAAGAAGAAGAAVGSGSVLTVLQPLLAPLAIPASIPPANTQRLTRTIGGIFAEGGDALPRLLATIRPALRPALYAALGTAKVTQPSGLIVYALRVKASLFGHNAPAQPKYDKAVTDPERKLIGFTNPNIANVWGALGLKGHKGLFVLALDAQYDQITPGSWLVVERPAIEGVDEQVPPSGFITSFHTVTQVRVATLDAFGITAKVTVLTLSTTWLPPGADRQPRALESTELLRNTRVYAQSETLALSEGPIPDPVCHATIELAGVYDGLTSGRWLIVSGERTDLPDTGGVSAAEVVMVSGVAQGFDPTLPGDKVHTTLTLAADLAYCYKRGTVTVYGNVVKATHGETRNEVLGGGDGAKVLQQFPLHASPVTYLPAPTATGAASTLQVRVNDVRWHEIETLALAKPKDRSHVTRTDDQDTTTIGFGDGEHGARLPTGAENVKARYRTGIGKPGNVTADRITLLTTKPLGVKSVTNPLSATGGANRDSLDQARQNVPSALKALDRLVSVQDYADFARAFAGIGKASALRLSDGRQEVVHVTVAGTDDIAIALSSDLYRNLLAALRDLGDPSQPVRLAVRELILLVISAGVRVLPDYQWEAVEPKVRRALGDAFGFARRELGQGAFLSEVLSTVQAVPGVAYVDVDAFGGVPEGISLSDLGDISTTLRAAPSVRAELARLAGSTIAAAQLAMLSGDVRDTLILKEIAP